MFDDDELLSHPLNGVTEDKPQYRPAKGIDQKEVRKLPQMVFDMLDKQMWRGASKVYRQYVPPKPVPAQENPKVGTGEEMPISGSIRPDEWYQFLSMMPVMWEEPIVFSEPFDTVQSATINFYEQATPIFQFEVPRQYFLVVQGVSYEVENASDEDIFDVELMRDGDTLARWSEYVMDAANANPANRYAFGGFSQPIPFRVRFDQDNHLTVRITYRGPKPFIFDSNDPFNQTAKVNVNGWICRMRDAREGAPKYVVNPLEDSTVNSYQELYQDIPRMASYMKTIYDRMHEADEGAD